MYKYHRLGMDNRLDSLQKLKTEINPHYIHKLASKAPSSHKYPPLLKSELVFNIIEIKSIQSLSNI